MDRRCPVISGVSCHDTECLALDNSVCHVLRLQQSRHCLIFYKGGLSEFFPLVNFTFVSLLDAFDNKELLNKQMNQSIIFFHDICFPI